MPKQDIDRSETFEEENPTLLSYLVMISFLMLISFIVIRIYGEQIIYSLADTSSERIVATSGRF